MQISATLLVLATAVCSTTATPLPLLSALTAAVSKVTHASTDSVMASVNPLLQPIVGGTLLGAVGLLSSVCPNYSACNTTVTGTISNLLTNGDKFVGKTSVAGWCLDGHCYGGVQLAGTLPAPITITCDSVTEGCTGFIYGSVNQTFVNGPQIELWGWIAPVGYCANGTCTGSVTILGDPCYK